MEAQQLTYPNMVSGSAATATLTTPIIIADGGGTSPSSTD
jgi:hypothetical protein